MAAKAQKKAKKVEKKSSAKAKSKPQVKTAAKSAKKAVKAATKKSAAPTTQKKLKAKVEAKDSKAKATNAKVEETKTEATEQEDEFDPQAFFEASGGKGIFRAHVMRKERVDFNLPVRYRFLDGPLVFNAELLNLSKGGLALRTPKSVKSKTVVRVEIPLPHTSELFTIQAECIWSEEVPGGEEKSFLTGFRFLQMSLAKQTVINNFIQQRRDEIVLAKIGLDKFKDSAPVVGID